MKERGIKLMISNWVLDNGITEPGADNNSNYRFGKGLCDKHLDANQLQLFRLVELFLGAM